MTTLALGMVPSAWSWDDFKRFTFDTQEPAAMAEGLCEDEHVVAQARVKPVCFHTLAHLGGVDRAEPSIVEHGLFW